MSAEIMEGVVAFENLTEHEMYNGQSTGKFSLVLSLGEEEAADLDARGVKLREYEGVKQRKFASKFEVGVLNADGTPFQGRVPRGSKVRLLWQEGTPHPVHGMSTYLNKVKVLEVAEQTGESEDF
tara:strand:+ start:1001 stop:1375 length:375 start_codon:yes stop_codon:yes gene_type:complete